MVTGDSKTEAHSGAVDNGSNLRFSFSIVHLLYMTTLLAAAIAMFESYATIWLLAVFLFWVVWSILSVTVKSVAARIAIALLLILGFLCLLMPAV